MTSSSNSMIHFLCNADSMPIFTGKEFGRCFEQVIIRSLIPIVVLLLSILVFGIRYARHRRENKLRDLGYLPFEAEEYKQYPEMKAIQTRNIFRLSVAQSFFSSGQVGLAIVSVARSGAIRPELISTLLLVIVWVLLFCF
jgi:hypothetical protein